MVIVQLKGPPTVRFDIELPCGWKSHGAAARDICLGSPSVKNFWFSNYERRNFCLSPATVGRMASVINQLEVTREDVLAAADRISGLVERTPLIESEVRGMRVWLKCECLQT